MNWRITWTVIAVGLLLVSLWWILLPPPRFALPTGKHGIGTQIFSWTDTSRPEPFTTDRSDRRHLTVQIWYPSAAAGDRQAYIDNAEVLEAIAQRFHLFGFLLNNLRNAATHAVRNGRPSKGRYPVLINPTGFSGFRAASLFWIEDLVSHGYIVVTLDQPGTAASALSGNTVIPLADKTVFDRHMPLALSQQQDQTTIMNGVPLVGGIIPFLADDLSFVLDRLEAMNRSGTELAGVFDLERAGVFGMSLGGYSAPEACQRDERFKACLAVDAGKSASVAKKGLAQPLMIISRDADIMREERAKAGGWPEPEIRHTVGSQRDLFNHNRGDAYYVTMNGMHHVNWTDAPTWSPAMQWIGLAGPIDPYSGFTLTNNCTRSFFDHYLKADRTSTICGTSTASPDLRLELRLARPSRH